MMESTNMTKPTESERLYVVETKLDTVLTAVEKTNSKIDELGTSLAQYVTRAELDKVVAEKDLEIASLRLEDTKLAKRHALSVWLTGVFAAGFGVVMTVLIQMAFK